MPVLSSDVAQQADYLQRIVNGQMPYRDFLDIYGPLNWIPPAVGYSLAGNQWFGVRVWMILVQLAILVSIYTTTAALSNKFYGIVTFLITLAYLGLPQTQNYTPYSFMHIFPLMMIVTWLLLNGKWCSQKKYCIAGILTGLAISLKISSGLFLFLAGLFICFYLNVPFKGHLSCRADENSAKPVSILLLKFLVGSLYLIVFTLFILPNFEKQYFWHLTFPLIVCIIVTLYFESKMFVAIPGEQYRKNVLFQIKLSVIYGLFTVISCCIILILFVPSGVTLAMLNYFPKILSKIDYSLPFALLNFSSESALETILLQGLWLQLPWILTVVFGLIFIGYWWQNERNGTWSTKFSHWKVRRLYQVLGLWMIAALGQYVIYPSPDWGHLIQNLPVWFIVIGMFAYCIELFWINAYRSRMVYRSVFLLIVGLWISPLVVFSLWKGGPSIDFPIKKPILESTEYLSKYEYGKKDHIQYEYYNQVITIANYIKKRSEPGDQCFTLSIDKIINFYAGKPLYGGRDSFLFYLLPHGRLTNEAFIHLACSDTIEKLIHDPPKFIINNEFNGGRNTKTILPQIEILLSKNYKKAFCIGLNVVYERNF